MGCDIHMFVEKYNNNTKNWESVGKKFPDDNVIHTIMKFMEHHLGTSYEESGELINKFLKGEEPKTKFEYHILKVFLPQEVPMEDDGSNWWGNEGKLSYPFTREPYIGRNYNLFGALGNVRNYDTEKAVAWERGLPDDVSDDICSLSDDWGVDSHSHNHLYLDELIDSKYYKMTEEELDESGLGTGFFNKTIDNILNFVDADPEDIRIVFWFDN